MKRESSGLMSDLNKEPSLVNNSCMDLCFTVKVKNVKTDGRRSKIAGNESHYGRTT